MKNRHCIVIFILFVCPKDIKCTPVSPDFRVEQWRAMKSLKSVDVSTMSRRHAEFRHFSPDSQDKNFDLKVVPQGIKDTWSSETNELRGKSNVQNSDSSSFIKPYGNMSAELRGPRNHGSDVPGSLKDDVPGAHKDDVPGSLKDDVPGAHKDDVPGAHKDDVPGAHKDDVPGSLKDDVPGSHKDDVPGSLKDDVPGVHINDVPGALKNVVAASYKNNVPGIHSKDVPGADEETSPGSDDGNYASGAYKNKASGNPSEDSTAHAIQTSMAEATLSALSAVSNKANLTEPKIVVNYCPEILIMNSSN